MNHKGEITKENLLLTEELMWSKDSNSSQSWFDLVYLLNDHYIYIYIGLIWFYDISNTVGHLMPYPFYTYVLII